MIPTSAIRLTEIIAGIGVLISSLEVLARPRSTDDGSWNSWRVLRLRRRWTSTGRTGAVADGLLGYPRDLIGVAVRSVAAAALVLAAPSGAWQALLLWLVTASLALRGLRAPYGGEGSDQVLLIVFGSLAMAQTFGGQRIALWFIVAEACLAYFSSGFAKVLHSEWRDGTGLLGVLRTRSWGNAWAAHRLSGRPTLCRWLSLALVSAETAFPLVLLTPPPLLPLLIGVALAFHVIVAITMGLNCFVWAFASCYPAVAYVVLGSVR
ncbi:hypothetical protein DR950_36295 [Kitasatospora xanthocidica]|uniref:HTTM domain-containing protein n=1 Tax=Kitasatospora xanthocidica TaxID=83382 RepID=A0A373A2W0_9ACTN|nr:hypothetical protein [Kitasatospora xanthocidica]RGD62493.1 hypothetical protein DR950_36295 [Kitasatospora xanthocidica]